MPGPPIQASSCMATMTLVLAVEGSTARIQRSLLSVERPMMTATVPASFQTGGPEVWMGQGRLVSSFVFAVDDLHVLARIDHLGIADAPRRLNAKRVWA